MSRCFTLLLTCTVVLGGCASSGPVAPPARLYDGVDACAREVSTHSAAAQEWFDQGLTLLYGFNHEEAIRSFQRATELDPGCSMAWWGLAMASGIDLNNSAMTEDDSRRAWDAAQQAAATAPGASPVEAALAKAITTRYTWPAPEDRSELDVAYAQAMEAVSKEFPADPDVACVYADSLMLLQPWDYWTAEGEPKGRIEEAIAVLEVVLAEEPDHAGACHFYIHALEAGQPERAIAAADRLLNRVPGAGHLLHMPSHIYVHVGRFADASDCNEIAIAADEAYFAVAPAQGFYQLYYAHNLHMLAFSAMMEGREKLATETAAQLVADIPASFVDELPEFVDGLMSTPLHVMVRFGKWDEILAEPEPPATRLLSRAQWHYARGLAFSSLGRIEEAGVEQLAFEVAAEAVPEEWRVGSNPSAEVLALARQMLKGELLWREGQADEAFAALAEGARLEDLLVYDEPPGWMQPVRHAFGALLMADKRFAKAERVYVEDLRRNPGNGWALLGLREALQSQGKDGPAAKADAKLSAAWKRADINAMSSCFCEPGTP